MVFQKGIGETLLHYGCLTKLTRNVSYIISCLLEIDHATFSGTRSLTIWPQVLKLGFDEVLKLHFPFNN